MIVTLRFFLLHLAVSFLFILPLSAQQTDSTHTTAAADSGTAAPLQADPVKHKKRPVVLNPHWSDFQGRMHASVDSLANPVFDFNDLRIVNYHGFGDVFRNQSSLQIFDFMEMGKPRYVAGLNLLPHQTAVNMAGYPLNDPTHGLYNLEFIALDAVENVEANSGAVNPVPRSANLFEGTNVQYQRNIHDTSYTRIMYRAGDFGFSNLDIEFAQKFSPRLTLQLGGINRSYDLNRQQFHGVNYRAALNYQVLPRLYANIRLNMNREDSYNQNTYFLYNYYKYRESRDDLLADLTYLPGDSGQSAWHMQAGISRTRRTNEFIVESIYSRSRFQRSFLSADHQWDYNKFNLLAAVSGYQYKTWGSPFSRKYTDSGLDGSVRLTYPLSNSVTLIPALRTHYLYDSGAYLLPGFEAAWRTRKFGLNLNYDQTVRFPTKNETSFNFEEFAANKELDNELMSSYKLAATYQPNPVLSLKSELVHRRISDEIRFDGSDYRNAGERSFSYLSAEGRLNWYIFSLLGGGQVSDASVYVSPKRSAWLQLRYRDSWLKGAVIIDAVGSVHWYDSHNEVIYNPVVERFYWSDARVDGYNVLSYKVTATVKDAQLYVAMDNTLGEQYSYISGYAQYFRRVRFGVNWLLWD